MQAHLLFKGATRPAMVFGVPLLPFVLCTLAAAILTIYTLVFLKEVWLTLAWVMVYAIVFLWMRAISKLDPWRLNQVLLRLRIRRSRGNSRLWHGVSFSPYRLERRKP